MIINHNKEKLINSIIYFLQNTENCKKTKLVKLLYFLDFTHFKDTGRSVTGLSYKAFPLGPYPEKLGKKIDKKNFEESMNKYIMPILSNIEITSDSLDLIIRLNKLEDCDIKKTYTMKYKNFIKNTRN